jgi:hypothetical protein
MIEENKVSTPGYRPRFELGVGEKIYRSANLLSGVQKQTRSRRAGW